MNLPRRVLFISAVVQQSCKAFTPSRINQIQSTTLEQKNAGTSTAINLNVRNQQQQQRHQTELFMIGDFFNFDKKDKKEENDVSSDDDNTNKKVQKGGDDDDPVEKMFNFFFGEKEESPMGLARFGAERFPGK